MSANISAEDAAWLARRARAHEGYLRDGVRIVRNPSDRWPFDLGKENPGAWVEMTDERADYCLEVLPPRYFKGGFAVSEPSDHLDSGEAVLWCVVKAGTSYYGRDLPFSQAPARALELRAALAVGKAVMS